MSTAGERITRSAKQALAFAKGESVRGCVVHIPEKINDEAHQVMETLIQQTSNQGYFARTQSHVRKQV